MTFAEYQGAPGDHAEAVALRIDLDVLDPDRRDALVLTQLIGLSYQEAAEVLGRPIGTVRPRVARARAGLVAGLDRAVSASSG